MEVDIKQEKMQVLLDKKEIVEHMNFGEQMIKEKVEGLLQVKHKLVW
jgi:hypothetical protein